MGRNSYLLNSHAAEHDRLIHQALVWEQQARNLFRTIGVKKGWKCLDVACGPVGVLPVLSDFAGPTGRVVGVDVDDEALKHAGRLCAERHNVHLQKGDIFDPASLPRGFRLVHGRFLLAPVGQAVELIHTLLSLAEPGGYIALQEPDLETWSVSPESDAFRKLTESIRSAFLAAGGNLNAGTALRRNLQASHCTQVRTRRTVLQLPVGHPYLELPLQMAGSLGLQEHVDQCRHDLKSRRGSTFTLIQCWARAPRDNAVSNRHYS